MDFRIFNFIYSIFDCYISRKVLTKKFIVGKKSFYLHSPTIWYPHPQESFILSNLLWNFWCIPMKKFMISALRQFTIINMKTRKSILKTSFYFLRSLQYNTILIGPSTTFETYTILVYYWVLHQRNFLYFRRWEKNKNKKPKISFVLSFLSAIINRCSVSLLGVLWNWALPVLYV